MQVLWRNLKGVKAEEIEGFLFFCIFVCFLVEESAFSTESMSSRSIEKSFRDESLCSHGNMESS